MDDNINERFTRPQTQNQSGQEGVIDALGGGSLLNYVQEDPDATTWVGLLGYDRFQINAFDAKIHNVDTIATPVDILNPIDDKVLSNTIQTGNNETD